MGNGCFGNALVQLVVIANKITYVAAVMCLGIVTFGMGLCCHRAMAKIDDVPWGILL
jgi:hypothetical protein